MKFALRNAKLPEFIFIEQYRKKNYNPVNFCNRKYSQKLP